MNNKFKRKLAAVSLFVVLASGYLMIEPQYDSRYEILDSDSAFARCSCGIIYIGDEDFLRNIPEEDNTILIEDQRNTKDPNMKIYNSCNICNREDRNNILEVLEEYERLNPSDWDRSIESMRLEWLLHNYSYYLNFEKNSTEDVDLNNLDEDRYNTKILQLLFRV